MNTVNGECLEDLKKGKLEEEQSTKIVTARKQLRVKSKLVGKDYDVNGLVKKLKIAMKNGWVKSYGLTAIQIGEPVRVCYYEYGEKKIVLVNPKIVSIGVEMVLEGEGCLSIPNKKFNTTRYDKVTVTALDINGEKIHITAKGTEAYILQHEIDHMDGILCTDRKIKEGPVSQNEVKQIIKKYKLEGVNIKEEAKLVMEKKSKLSANQRAIVLVLHANVLKESIGKREG